MTASRTSADLGRGEPVGDVADRAGEGEDQRRHRQHREERRLGGQAGDPVAHARADGGDDQSPEQLAEPRHRAQTLGREPVARLGSEAAMALR